MSQKAKSLTDGVSISDVCCLLRHSTSHKTREQQSHLGFHDWDAPSIHPVHFQEWVASGVSTEIIEANVQSLGGQAALESLTENAIAKVQKVSSYTTKPAGNILDGYAHILDGDGGWFVTGLDPLNELERMSWGQFKPNTPKLKENGKPQKYHSPQGVEARAIFLEVPSDPDLWKRVLADSSITIYLLEGAKKAGLLLTHNFVAIALPGVWMGTRKDGLGGRNLIPELVPFAVPGRRFIFVFDEDTKESTRNDVAEARWKTAKELQRRYGCECLTTNWSSSEGKGIDDVWANHGIDRVLEILNNPQPLEQPGEPDPDEYQRVKRQQEEQAQIELAQQQERERWARETREKAAKAAWLRSKQYTPTERVNEQFISLTLPDILAADIHALLSTMETGKTQALARILAEWEGGVVAIGSRTSLLIQSCERWGDFYHLQRDQAHPLIPDPNSRIAVCVDSLKHFKPSDFEGKLIILDEVTSVAKHGLFSGTLKGKRAKALERLEQAVQNGAAVVAWDGNNCDTVINYLTALRGDNCRVIKRLNEFEGRTLNIEVVRTVSQVFTDEGDATVKVRLNDHSPVTQKLLDTLESYRFLPDSEAKAIAIITDSQRLGEALEGKFGEKGYKVLRIDAKTIGTEAGKQFQPNPNAYLAEHKYDAVILSPVAQEGYDINIKNYFRHGVAFFFGVLDTDAQTQFLRRFRNCLDWTVWCQEYSTIENADGRRSPIARRLSKQVMDYLELDAVAALQGTDREALAQSWFKQFRNECQDEHYQAAIQLEAAWNYERSHIRECLEERLEAKGHNVTVTDAESLKDTRKLTSEAREAIIMADSNSIFHADISGMTLSDALRIKSSFAASLEDGWKAEKFFLAHRLPGIENTTEWSVEFVAKVLYRDKKLIGQLEAYWMLNHMDAAKQKAAEFWQQTMEQGKCFLLDIRSNFTRLRALNHLGLLALIGNQEYHKDSEKLVTIRRKCKHSQNLQIALGCAPGKRTPTDWVGRLMRSVGVDSKSRRDSNGGRYYTYVDPTQDPVKGAILSCLDRRFSVLTGESGETQAQQALQPCHLNPKINTNIGGGGSPETPKTQGFDADLLRLTDVDEEKLLAPDSLEDIFQTWMAGDAEERAILMAMFPPNIIQRALWVDPKDFPPPTYGNLGTSNLNGHDPLAS